MARKRHIETEAELARPPVEPATDIADRSLTVTELAARWRVDRHSVTAAIKSGRLQAFCPNQRGYRIRLAEVLRFESAQRVAVAS